MKMESIYSKATSSELVWQLDMSLLF